MLGVVTPVVSTVAALSTATAAENVQAQQLIFQSGGKRIRLEVFTPRAVKKAPTVLVVHGAGGIDAGNRYVRQLAEAMAGQGFATLLVHYFDRTDTTWASDATIYKNFETWLETLRDTINFAAQQPNLDTSRLGVVGYSLGGYLAVAQSARDLRIKAVVELAGGIDGAYAAATKQLPPMLLVHGEADQRVPFTRAKELQTLLGKLKVPFETRFYPGEGHILSPFAALDALGAGIEFLRRHLRSA